MAYQTLPPVQLANVDTVQRDTLEQVSGLTVFNLDSGTPEVWLGERWSPAMMLFGQPNAGDGLTWDPILGYYVPTPTSNPLFSSLRIYNDATNVLEVKRIYSGLALTNTSGLTTAGMTPGGVHTLAGSTNKSYRIRVDSASTVPWENATFEWSEDGGTNYNYSGVAVATGVAGRQILAPIMLSNGVSILFTPGVLSNGDHWDFVAIAANNQLYDLKVDTTNSVVQVGITLNVVDANFGLSLNAGTQPQIQVSGSARWQYNRVDQILSWYDANVPLVVVNQSSAGPGNYPSLQILNQTFFQMNNVTGTPTPAGATYGMFYARGSLPYWQDTTNETRLPLANRTESITGTWTFTAATITTLTATTLTTNTLTVNSTSTFTGSPTFNASIILGNIATTPSTPGTGVGKFYTYGAGAAKPRWLDNGGVESLLAQLAKNETVTGVWRYQFIADTGGTARITLDASDPNVTLTGTVSISTATITTMAGNVNFTGTPTFSAATFTTATVTTLTAPTIAGTTTASGAWTFSAAGTALTVNNNATVSGTLTAVTLSSTTATITTINATTIAGSFTMSGATITVTNTMGIGVLICTLIVGGTIFDSAIGTRITVATASPHVLLTGDVKITGKSGFYNTAPQTQQAGVENITNNVTVGGTNGTIADFTSLTVYATDAAAIRNDIYQLARSLKQVKDALRLYGLLS